MDLENWKPLEIRARGHNITLIWAIVGLLLAFGSFFYYTGSDADRGLVQAMVFAVFCVWMIIERARDEHHAASTAGNVALGFRVVALITALALAATHIILARSNGFAEGAQSGFTAVVYFFYFVLDVIVAGFIGWEMWSIHAGSFQRYVNAVQEAARQQQPRNMRDVRGDR